MKDPQNIVPLAVLTANAAHKGQTRRDLVTPYFNHLSNVAYAVAKQFGFALEGDPYVATAYLHDIIEDTETTADDLRRLFHPDIVDAVVALTHRKNEPYLDYINRVAGNHIATVVKIQDIYDNRSDAPTERQLEKYTKALAILRSPLYPSPTN